MRPLAEPAQQAPTEFISERWRPGRKHVLGGLVVFAGLVLLPGFSGGLLQNFGAWPLGLALAGSGLLSAIWARQPALAGRLGGLAAATLGLATLLSGSPEPIQLLPALIYVGIGIVFIHSLLGTDSMIERAARTLEPDAPPFIRSYCRKLTAVWALLFFANAAVISSLTFSAPWNTWLTWTTWGSWLSMGLFSGVEFLFRKSWFRYYFYLGPFDRRWARMFPAEATSRGRRSTAYIAQMRREKPEATRQTLWSKRVAPETSPTQPPSRLLHWSRVLRTGSAFALFGAASLLLAAFAAASALWRTEDFERSSLRTQRTIHQLFRAFTAYMRSVGILTLEVRGENLNESAPGQIIVANHPTLLDVVFLVAQFPQADCIVKREAWSNPYLGGAVRAAGYIPNDEGQELIEACAARLAAGRSVLLFPEGTRSPKQGLAAFQRGAAHIALEAGCDILPIRIECDPPTLMRGQKWYDVPDRAMHYTIEAGEPFSTLPYLEAIESGEPRGRVARRMTASLRKLF